MIEVDPSRFVAAVSLFDVLQQPNIPMIWSVFEGNVPGRVFVDAETTPRLCLVFCALGFWFLSGVPDADQLAEIQAYILADGDGGLCVTRGVSDSLIWRTPPYMYKERTEFLSGGHERERLLSLAARTPPGTTIVPIDSEAVLTRCNWAEFIIGAYGGSASRCLDKSIGVCLVDEGGSVSSEAYAMFVGNGVAEIALVTRDGCRGQGLATAAAAHLLLKLSDMPHPLRPYWSCDTANAASMAIARKLGFTDERVYDVHVIYQPPVK